MSKLSKRESAIRAKLTPGKLYPIEEAFTLLREVSKVKFPESVEVAVNLGVDPRKSDQVVRGSTVLPNGTGKQVRVAVFAQGANAEAAAAAGADRVGFEDLAAEVLDRKYRLEGLFQPLLGTLLRQVLRLEELAVGFPLELEKIGDRDRPGDPREIHAFAVSHLNNLRHKDIS